jgi:hypothetical protein
MSVSRLKAKARKSGERGLAVANGAAARGAAYTKARVGGWIERVSRRLASYRWTNVALAALALLALAMLV